MKSFLTINPPILNSANPWCTSLEQLQELYDYPHTGAVTTRTSLLKGFPHDWSIHQFAFFDPNTHDATHANPQSGEEAVHTASLNTLGYSPIPLAEYLGFVQTISDGIAEVKEGVAAKPFVISVTGTVDEVVESYQRICARRCSVRMDLAMEVNLSCPNIVGKPPPAYDSTELLSYLIALKVELGKQLDNGTERETHVPIGIKTPPYTYDAQFQSLLSALLAGASAEPVHIPCPISFITSTNTLGSSLLIAPTLDIPPSPSSGSSKEYNPTLASASGAGIGGLAGAPLHPLALGNVYTIKTDHNGHLWTRPHYSCSSRAEGQSLPKPRGTEAKSYPTV